MNDLARRRFLGTAAGLALGAPFLLRSRGAGAEGLARPMIERASRPLDYETPLDVYATRITPVDRFYIRNHFDQPTIDVATWRYTPALPRRAAKLAELPPSGASSTQ